jgi:hypothetical protein
MRAFALTLVVLLLAACAPEQRPPSVDGATNSRLGTTFSGEPIHAGQGELKDRALVLYYFATG